MPGRDAMANFGHPEGRRSRQCLLWSWRQFTLQCGAPKRDVNDGL